MQLNYYPLNKSYQGTARHEKEMNRTKVYWICQLSGWLLYAVVNIIGLISVSQFSWDKFPLFIFLFLTGIGSTHILRYIIKKNNWVSLSLKKIVPRVLASCLITGTLLFSLFYITGLLTGSPLAGNIKPGIPLVWIFNISSVILLWCMIYFSIHFFENYKKAEIEAYIWEAAVKDFELKTLKSQLNPHFMFNAMNSIRALIEEDPEIAKTALTKLSNLMRYSLKIERFETVPLEEEMQTVSDYLALERVRYEERLNYTVAVDPETSRVEIPPMMVQTLVENGIKHGIAKRTEGGKIFVTSRLEDSLLHITIKNNGHIKDGAVKNSKGFGISNTKHRLNLLYGENASFTIKNENNDFVSVELIIPTGGKINESFNNR